MMIEHLSYSSISAYLACGQAWKFKYIDQIPTPTSPELVFGSAFHGTVEQYLANDYQDDLLQLWQQNWSTQLEQNPDIEWVRDTPESYCNLGIRMFSNEDIQRGILNIHADKIETLVELHVPGVPIPVIGYIDVITTDGIPGDFKTSAKSWTMDRALNEMQPVFYLAALNQLGIHSHSYRFRHYVFVKTKTPQFQVIEHAHSPGQMFWLFTMICKVWQAIDAEVYPLNPSTWKCNPLYCEYWSMCRGKYI